MFQLTMDEVSSISRFQVETLKGQGHNIKNLPYAFTEARCSYASNNT